MAFTIVIIDSGQHNTTRPKSAQTTKKSPEDYVKDRAKYAPYF